MTVLKRILGGILLVILAIYFSLFGSYGVAIGFVCAVAGALISLFLRGSDIDMLRENRWKISTKVPLSTVDSI